MTDTPGTSSPANGQDVPDGKVFPHDRGGGYDATPRWVKILAMVAAVLVLLAAVMLLSGGNHGPGRHLGGGSTASTDSQVGPGGAGALAAVGASSW